MLYAKDYRQKAWNAQNGKWGTLALTFLVYSVIIGICAGFSFYYVGVVATLLLSGPLTLGLTMQSLRVIKNESVSVNNLFDGFKNFINALLISLINGIFIFLWSLLFIIPGIIKSLSYSMTYYISCDNPEMSADDARKESMRIMKGNEWRLFCLYFSFIGWYLLCLLTFGILTFWVAPYQQVAVAAFYKDIVGNQPLIDSETTVITDENI